MGSSWVWDSGPPQPEWDDVKSEIFTEELRPHPPSSSASSSWDQTRPFSFIPTKRGQKYFRKSHGKSSNKKSSSTWTFVFHLELILWYDADKDMLLQVLHSAHKWWAIAGSNRDASRGEGYIFLFEFWQGLRRSYFYISTRHNLFIAVSYFSLYSTE